MAELVCESSSAIEVASDGVCEDEAVCMISGTATTDVGVTTPADSVTIDCATGGEVDEGGGDGDGDGDDGEPITAVSIVSELVGAILAGGSEGAAEGTTTDSLDCRDAFGVGTSGAGDDGSRTAGGRVVASDMRTALPVPAAEDTAACDVGRGTTAGCSNGEDDAGGSADGGGGGAGSGG